jgi:hypothetical protein
MRRHIVRALVAAVAAGGALLTAGLAGATAAAAATPAAHTTASKVIYTPDQAGYKAEGRWFRFVAITVKVPAPSTYSHFAEVALMGTNVSPVYLAVKAGGGANSVGWSVGVQPFGMGGGVLSNVQPKGAEGPGMRDDWPGRGRQRLLRLQIR